MRASRSRLSLRGAEGEAVLVETERPWRLALWNRAALAPDEYRWQVVGEDLLLWIDRTLETETSLQIVGG